MSKRIDFDAAEVVEQIVSGQPTNRATVGQLMDEFFADYDRNRRVAGEPEDDELSDIVVPVGFDPRNYTMR